MALAWSITSDLEPDAIVVRADNLQEALDIYFKEWCPTADSLTATPVCGLHGLVIPDD